MNTVLSTTLGRHDHPPQPNVESPATSQTRKATSRPVRRVTIVDRAALHLGLTLIRWGRRPLDLESRERRAVGFEQHLDRLERESLAQRWQLLHLPPR
ncbi:MAG: hypothetical protein V4531_04525 [Actinomycetota bacterium]